MALFTDLASLSQTATSNAADGSVDAPSTLDNQLNLLASFIAQLRDGNYTPPAGTVLQELVLTDAGSTTGSSSLTNVTASVKNITPKSSNSTLIVEVTFQAGVSAGGSGTNTQGTFQIFNNTASANIGAAYTQSVQSGTGANMQSDGMGIARATVANSALTTVGFTLRAKYSTATAATVTATGQVWTIREIQN